MDRITNKLLKLLLILVSLILFFYLLPKFKTFINATIVFLLPFILGFTLAFLVNPLVDFFERFKIKRSIIAIIILIIFIGIITLFVYLIVPTLINQIQKLITNLPNYLESLEKIINQILGKLKIENYKFNITTSKIMSFIYENKHTIIDIFTKIIQGTFSYIVIFIVTPILMLYFIIYYHQITTFIKNIFLRRRWNNALSALYEIAISMRSYLKGIVIVMVILTILSTFGLMFIQLDLPLLWGTVIGITNIIPYIGPYIGGSIVLIFTLSTVPQRFFSVLILIILLQFIESNFITPHMESKSIKTNPILAIFFVTLFGKLFGIIGMLMAIPVLSIIQIIFKAKKYVI